MINVQSWSCNSKSLNLFGNLLFTSHLFYLSIDNPVVNTDCPPHRIASPGFAASHKYSTAPCVHNIYTHTHILCEHARAQAHIIHWQYTRLILIHRESRSACNRQRWPRRPRRRLNAHVFRVRASRDLINCLSCVRCLAPIACLAPPPPPSGQTPHAVAYRNCGELRCTLHGPESIPASPAVMRRTARIQIGKLLRKQVKALRRRRR